MLAKQWASYSKLKNSPTIEKKRKKGKIKKVVKKLSVFLSFFFRKKVLYQQNCNQFVSLIFLEQRASMQIALKAVKENKRPKYIKFRRKISKTDQKPPNLHKTQINYLKPSIPIRTSPNPIQYHNQTS